MTNAPLVPVTITFLLGILFATHAPVAPTIPLLGGFIGAAMVWRMRAQPRSLWAVMLVWCCLGMLRMTAWSAHPDHHLKDLLCDEPQPVRLHGVVTDDPVELFEPHEFGRTTCVIDLRHVRMNGRWQALQGRVRATLQDAVDPVTYGDELLVEGEWSRVPSPGNPGQYDWRRALARQRIHGLLRVKPFNGVVMLRRHQGQPWFSAVFRLRDRWEDLIRTIFRPQDEGLLRSLLLGQRVALEERLKDAFVETGTIHLLVISGFNVGLIAALCELLFRVLGIPWRLRLVHSAIALGGYCVLTGLQPPVARATLMAWVVLGSYALDRVISWPNALALAALVILWVNPTQLFDPGFQLSFGAVLSLLIFTPKWSAWLQQVGHWVHPDWLRRYVALSVSATAAIWVGLSPILAWYFDLVSPISMLANLLLAPLMSVLVILGTSLLTCGTFMEPVMRWGSGMMTWLLHAIVSCVSWCHAIPGGYWFIGRPVSAWLVGYYALLTISVAGLRRGWTRSRVLICWVAALAVWVWSVVAVRVEASRWLCVDVLDVGHGDSILVRTPRGETLLIDAGSQDAGRARVVPFLRWAGLSTLDALVLTHSDEDHLGGAIPLLEHIRVKRLLTNGVRDDTMSARLVRRLAAAHHVPEVVLAAGMRIAGDSSVAIEVLHPPPGLVSGVAPKSNDNSIVVRIAKGTVSVLLTGDIEEGGLPVLLGSGQLLPSTVLKVPHHGSRLGSAGEAFFHAVHPAVAVLSVGRLHHLPAPETLEALSRTGAAQYLTRDDGAIQIRTNGSRLKIVTFKQQRSH